MVTIRSAYTVMHMRSMNLVEWETVSPKVDDLILLKEIVLWH